MLKETSKPGSKVNKTKSLFIDKIWRIEAKFKNFINLATPLTNLKHTHVRPIKVKRRHNSGKTKEAFSSLGLSIKHPYGELYIWNFSIVFEDYQSFLFRSCSGIRLLLKEISHNELQHLWTLLSKVFIIPSHNINI